MRAKDKFAEIFREKVHRPGADALLAYLLYDSDFFTAPASTKYHGSYPGGLCEHSLHVYENLVDYLNRPRVTDEFHLNYSDESIAVVALLHDLCKIGCYHETIKHRKNLQTNQWEDYRAYDYSDPLPLGHGEKSVIMISRYMQLNDDEIMAIRWHMGFSGSEDTRTIGQGLSKCPLAVALSFADQEATYFQEG